MRFNEKAAKRVHKALALIGMARDLEDLRVEHIIAEARERGLKI